MRENHAMRLIRLAVSVLAVGAAIGLGITSTADAQGKAKAKQECFWKASEGTNTTEEGAKFQAFEALLQATDWGLWAAWMANGSTPGYDVGKAKYKCTKGTGLGVTCRSQVRICKKA
jgi:hypothetical protein